jgi:ATP-binding cassette, subfamily B, bacterial PglK
MVMFARTVRETLRLLGRDGRWRWALLVVLALVVAGFEALGAMLVYSLMGLISGEAGAMSLPVVGDLTARFSDIPLRTLQLAVAGLVAGFFLVRALIVVGEVYVQSRFVYNAGRRLSNHLVRGYLAMPYLSHTQLNSSELVRNAFDSVQSLVNQVLKPAVHVLAETVLVIGLTAVLLVVTPQATLIALAVLGPAVWLLLVVIQPRLKRLGRASQESRRGTLLAMQQALGGIRDIRLLGREREFASSFAQQRGIMARTAYLKHTLAELPRVLIETTFVLVIAVVFVLAVLTGDGPEALVSTLGVFAYAGLRLQPSLRKIVQGLNHIRFGSAIVEDLLEDRARVDAALEVRGAADAAGPQDRPFSRAIELRGVSFSYAPDAPPALREIDLTIRRGEFLGICGPTGGGKSTLIDLIVGLLQPTHGEVLVDGRPLGEHPAWWYAQLGVVSQSVYLIDDTLRANIAFGRPEATIDDDLLQRSIDRAQLREVVAELPHGLDTIVGERGVRLSGGQRQRVAVARALYREPAVIVLDEGTSALDGATEAALVAAVDDLKTGRTLISVAHRIATVRQADRILVVAGGRIVADGNHDELLQGSELFRGLAR